ncbi:MAG: PepSY-associated TM helix domain-containing protein [Myxococcota bacterium]
MASHSPEIESDSRRPSIEAMPELPSEPVTPRLAERRIALEPRKIALFAHRWVGLLLTVFLVVAGATGTLIAFFHELDGVFAPDLHHLSEPVTSSDARDPLVLRRQLEDELPEGARVSYVKLSRDEAEPLVFFVDTSALSKPLDNQWSVHPQTGDVLGSRDYGNLSQGSINLMPFIYRLHYSLALGRVGVILMGIVALLWTVDCFVGAYLTTPRRRRAEARTSRSWFARWKPAWLIRTTQLFSFAFTWHRASGLWLWGLLLIFAWSAVGLNLSEVYNPLMRATLGYERAYEQLDVLDELRTRPQLDYIEARAVGRDRLESLAAEGGFQVYREHTLSYDSARGVYRYRVYSSRDISSRYPNTTLFLDGDSGELLQFETATGQFAGNTVTTWLFALHFGAVGGRLYQSAVSVFGLVVCGLGVSGVWIWWRKRRKRRCA